MADLPRGTVTFLLTDIEGSTARWERDRQAMAAAVARHVAVLDAAIQTHGGVHFKTVGDAVQAAFPTAARAVAAALAGQQALLAENWREVGALPVRMALHAGEAEPDERGDYLAGPLNRLSRLLATGHGGQILLSQSVQQLSRGALPPSAELHDLGEHRLRDLLEPERIFQLVHPSLPAGFPPPRSLETRPNNLPRQPTSFLGRERELTAIIARLRDPEVQLLTLTGPGGTGKTRLALQAASDLLDDFADGVFFVPLAPLADARLVPAAIAAALGLREDAGQSIADRLRAYLARREILLVLDNVEHLLPAAPDVAELLGAAPNVRVLATSRAPLHVRAEREFPVLPLGLPRRQPPPTAEQLTQFEAVRLFIDRAQAVKPDFTVDNENAPAIAEICWRLDGLPLAIELAATRVRLLPPMALLARLDKRLPVLTGGARDAPARQQTLRAAIAWSHDLLREEERILFRRLAVFAGGCTLEAAEAVANPDGALDSLAGITSLVEQSLLRLDADAVDEIRVEMLETVGEYASEQLATSGEEASIRRRHAQFFLALANTADAHAWRLEQAVWLDRLDAEHPNLRAALAWAIESGEADEDLGLALAAALGTFWRLRGHLREGLSWLQRSLERGGSPAARLRMMGHIIAIARELQTIRMATDIAEAALVLAETSGGQHEIADAKLRLASALIDSGDGERPPCLLADARAWYRSAGDAAGEARVLAYLGLLAEGKAEFVEARALAAEARDLFRAAGDSHGESRCLFSLAYLAIAGGEGERALELVAEAIAICRTMGNTLDVAAAGYTLGMLHADHVGDDRAAEPFFVESLELWRPAGNVDYVAGILAELARLAMRAGDFALAQTRYQEVLALRRASPDAIVAALGSSEVAIGLSDIARAKGETGEAMALMRDALTRLRDVAPAQWQRAGLTGQWVKLLCAEALRLAACMAGTESKAARAARILGAADAFRTASGWGVLRAERARQEGDASAIRARLDKDELNAAWTSGQTLAVTTALDEALALLDTA